MPATAARRGVPCGHCQLFQRIYSSREISAGSAVVSGMISEVPSVVTYAVIFWGIT